MPLCFRVLDWYSPKILTTEIAEPSQRFTETNAYLGSLDAAVTRGNCRGAPAILHDHIRNDVVVRSMPGSVVL
jgi:hypothetical protein